jgi:ankyrin repeat protein
VEEGKVNIVLLLMECGGEVNSHDMWGLTLLHYASGLEHLEVLRLLIDRGMDIRAVDGRGQTPYQLSLAYGY